MYKANITAATKDDNVLPGARNTVHVSLIILLQLFSFPYVFCILNLPDKEWSVDIEQEHAATAQGGRTNIARKFG